MFELCILTIAAWIWHHEFVLNVRHRGRPVSPRAVCVCVCVWRESVSCVRVLRVLRVNKWEALELFLVQVGYKLLIWGGQLGGVAREKAIKVLCVAPTLPWRGERDGRGMEGGEWVWWGMWGGEKRTTTKGQREKREIQLKHGINQSNHAQSKLWISIGPHVSEAQHLVTDGGWWLGSGGWTMSSNTYLR